MCQNETVPRTRRYTIPGLRHDHFPRGKICLLTFEEILALPEKWILKEELAVHCRKSETHVRQFSTPLSEPNKPSWYEYHICGQTATATAPSWRQQLAGAACV